MLDTGRIERNIMRRWWVLPLILLALLLAASVLLGAVGQDTEHNEMAAFLVKKPGFILQIVAYTALALAVNWVVEQVIDEKWYDAGGSGLEMERVRERVGTDAERHTDALAVGANTIARSIRIAVIFGSLFAMGH